MTSEEVSSIGPTSSACLEFLNRISFLLRDRPEEEKEFGITYSSIYDELARFKLWADNIGAFQPTESAVSLAKRLKNAPRAAGQVVELLKDMTDALVDVHAILSGDRVNNTYEFRDSEIKGEPEGSSSKLSPTGGPLKGHVHQISEIQDLFGLISEITSNLFRLSTKIRKATPRDRYLRAATAFSELKIQYGCWDIAHVENKFPKLRPLADGQQNWLAGQLGRAITWRRQYLRYCQEHASKVSTIRKSPQDSQPRSVQRPPVASEPGLPAHTPVFEAASPQSTTTLTTPSTFLEGTVPDDVGTNETQEGDEEVAPSTHATSVGTVEGESPAIIRLENVRKGNNEFICPFCAQTQKYRRDRAWKDHALEDLRPYVCTFEDCDLVLFPRRHDWFDHERQHHRVQWICSFCDDDPYSSEIEFQTHLRDLHKDEFIEPQLQILVDDGRRPLDKIPAADCPFCDDFDKITRRLNPQLPKDEVLTVSWPAFRNHVGRHLKSLATFAIPRYSEEDDQSSIVSGDSAKAAVAITDADILKEEVAPRKIAAMVESQTNDIQSVSAQGSEVEVVDDFEVIPVPDAPESSFIGLNGLPEVGAPFTPEQDPNAKPVQAFLSWMERNFAYSVLGPTPDEERPFVPLEKIQRYFSSVPRTTSSKPRLHVLLDDLGLVSTELLPAVSDNILQNYILVLCILLSFGEGGRLRDFIENDISDRSLPFHQEELQNRLLPTLSDLSLQAQQNLCKFFCAQQWQFCVPVFESSRLRNQYFSLDQRLPIVRKEDPGLGLVNPGMHSEHNSMFLIWLHESYNQLIDEEAKTALSDDYSNRFVLEISPFDEGNSSNDPFFDALREQSSVHGVMRYYGSFRQGNFQNAIFEFADKGNMEIYFEREAPPQEYQDIRHFWNNLFQLANCLSKLHQMDQTPELRIQGYHLSLSPRTIFVVSNEVISPYSWKFKLSGLPSLPDKSIGSDDNSSKIYEAPEVYHGEEGAPYHLHRADIWSLGCVFSEAAVWVTGGYQDVLAYRTARMSETLQTLQHGPRSPSGSFHNGVRLLDTVTLYHDAARKKARRVDGMTSMILDMIENGMLAPNSDGRLTAIAVWERCTNIYSDASKVLPLGRQASTSRGRREEVPEPVPDIYEPELRPRHLAKPRSIFNKLLERRTIRVKEEEELAVATFSRPAYSYFPLHNSTEVRLVTLLPSTLHEVERIEITLQTVHLEDLKCPLYEALSYTWGATSYSRQISIEGRIVAVTNNLYEALFYLRHRDKPRILWIDALCINMSDIQERSHQILRMRDIFRLATRVLIWLGPESDDSALALKTLGMISSKVHIDRASSTVATVSHDASDWIDHAAQMPFDMKFFRAISHLLQRPLFHRLWIFQEIHLASDNSIVISGHDSIGLEHFRNAIWYLAWRRVYEIDDEHLEMRASLFDVLALVDKVSDASLRSLIERTRNSGSTDPRDRIYALLALTNTPLEIIPDYSRSTLDVYQDVVLQHIFVLGDLNVLSSCEAANKYDWPSWVPDWSVRSQCWQPFSALYSSGDTYPEAGYAGDDVTNRALNVCGVYADHVEVVYDFTLSETTDIEAIPRIQQLLSHSSASVSYVGGGSLPEAYWRTLCGNRVSDRYIPPRKSLLDPRQSREAVSELVNFPNDGDPSSLGPHATRYLREFQTMARGRSLFTTRNGYLGLGTNAIRPNDAVCVLLGCKSLMMLRPAEPGFIILGETYIHGLSETQALLGPLPDDFSFVYQYNDATKSFQAAYLDSRSGVATIRDPRLEPLPPGWHVLRYPEENACGLYVNENLAQKEDETRSGMAWKESCDPRLTPDALRKRGVSLQTFRLL